MKALSESYITDDKAHRRQLPIFAWLFASCENECEEFLESPDWDAEKPKNVGDFSLESECVHFQSADTDEGKQGQEEKLGQKGAEQTPGK